MGGLAAVANLTELISTYFHDTVDSPSWMTPLLGAVFPAGLFVAVVIPGAWYQRIGFAAKRRLCLSLQTLALLSAAGLTAIGGDSTPLPAHNGTHNGTHNGSFGHTYTTIDNSADAAQAWGPRAEAEAEAVVYAAQPMGRYSTTSVAILQVVLLFCFTFGIGIAYYIPLHAASVRHAPYDAGQYPSLHA